MGLDLSKSRYPLWFNLFLRPTNPLPPEDRQQLHLSSRGRPRDDDIVPEIGSGLAMEGLEASGITFDAGGLVRSDLLT